MTMAGAVLQLCTFLVIAANIREGLSCSNSSITVTTSSYDLFSDSNYPNNYRSGLSCMYSVGTTPGYRIGLSIRSFNTEDCCDYLDVFDGTSTTAPSVRLSGVVPAGQVYISNGSSVTLRFTTDASVTRSGFHFSIFRTLRAPSNFGNSRNETEDSGESGLSGELIIYIIAAGSAFVFVMIIWICCCCYKCCCCYNWCSTICICTGSSRQRAPADTYSPPAPSPKSDPRYVPPAPSAPPAPPAVPVAPEANMCRDYGLAPPPYRSIESGREAGQIVITVIAPNHN